MFGREARRLQKALRALVDDCIAESLDGHPLSTRTRLYQRITRHLPIDGAEKASEFAPPMWTLNLARKLKMPMDRAVAVAAAGTVYFSTADLADDIADGDLAGDVDDIGIHVTDVCRLTFLYQQAVDRIPDIDAAQKLAIANVFARRGQQMADGQELDLRGTDAMESADPLTIARNKSGAEFAAMGEIVAIAAGLEPGPWAEAGAAFGTAAQTTSDFFDLFLDPESDDWATGKPTLPMYSALKSAGQRGPVLDLLAGERTAIERKAAGLWHLVQTGSSAALTRQIDASIERMTTETRRGGHPKALTSTTKALHEIAHGVAEALDEYRGDDRPPLTSATEARDRCVAALERFLTDTPPGAAVMHHRRALLDAADLQAVLFGPLAIVDVLQEVAGAPPGFDVDALLAAAHDQGARFYAGRDDMPPDTLVGGLLLRVAARAGHAAHDAVQATATALRQNARRDGLIPTWLADRTRWRRETVEARWGGRLCPGASARALHGLWLVDASTHGAAVNKGALTLAERMCGSPAGLRSTYASTIEVQYDVARLLSAVRTATRGRARATIDQGLRAIADRFSTRRRLDGRMGAVLHTAMAARVLLEVDRLGLVAFERPSAVARALIDAQEADGGYPAEPSLSPPVPVDLDGAPAPRPFASRTFTAAHVLATLTTFTELSHDVGI